MRLFLLVCLLGAVSADLLEDAVPILDESLIAFFQGAAKADSISKILGFYDPEIEQLADDIEQGLGRTIIEALKEVLRKIQDHVDNGKEVGRELIKRVKELRDQLKELDGEKGEKAKQILKQIREKAKEALRNILERLGLGKRNIDDSMDHVARMKFQELVDRVKDKILSDENIQKIKEYIKNTDLGETKFVRKLKEFALRLRDHELREILSHLLEHRNIQRGETWEKLKNFFKDFNIKIQEHSRKFGEWVKDMWGKGLDKLKDKYGAIRAIAMEFISHSKDMSAEMAREALEFFRPYKEDLGSLWDQMIDATKEAIGKF